MLYNVDSYYDRVMKGIEETVELNDKIRVKVDNIKETLKKYETGRNLSK